MSDVDASAIIPDAILSTLISPERILSIKSLKSSCSLSSFVNTSLKNLLPYLIISYSLGDNFSDASLLISPFPFKNVFLYLP